MPDVFLRHQSGNAKEDTSMNRHTRKKLLNFTTAVAVVATALVVFLPATQAAPGTLTSNVNVRQGPGTNYAVVDTVRTGQTVDVQQCQGSWCYIQKPGPDGWVSAQYLSANGRPVNPSQPGLSFGFNIGGPGGPNISIGIGQPPQVQPPVVQPPVVRPPQQPQRPPMGGPRPPIAQPGQRPPIFNPPQPPRPSRAEVCFYDRTQFRGDSFCLSRGDSTADLRNWTDRISSIQNNGGLSVQVCSEPRYRNCRTYTTSAGTLNDFDDFIASVRVQ
jgi:hypothetical protein